MRAPTLVLAPFGLAASILAYAAMIGLGLLRHGEAFAVSASATALVFGPGLAAGWAAETARSERMLWVTGAWSVALLAMLPVYFPGERRDAVAAGLAVAGFGRWDDAARGVADRLPPEPPLARPTSPEAERVAARPPPAPLMLADHQIALPFEGAGRRLMVPVVFAQGGQEREVQMMLDTGATYTTLPLAVLAEMGIAPRADSPSLTLHTANGERQAQLVLLDAVWLGDLELQDVAIAVCDACGSDDVAGLLGLNVTGGFNLTIDADREEIVFARRPSFGRHLDVRPFLDVDASFVRFAGGRVEARLEVLNLADRAVQDAQVSVHCDEERFQVSTGGLEPGEPQVVLRRLPNHPPCASYQVSVTDASW